MLQIYMAKNIHEICGMLLSNENFIDFPFENIIFECFHSFVKALNI